MNYPSNARQDQYSGRVRQPSFPEASCRDLRAALLHQAGTPARWFPGIRMVVPPPKIGFAAQPGAISEILDSSAIDFAP